MYDLKISTRFTLSHFERIFREYSCLPRRIILYYVSSRILSIDLFSRDTDYIFDNFFQYSRIFRITYILCYMSKFCDISTSQKHNLDESIVASNTFLRTNQPSILLATIVFNHAEWSTCDEYGRPTYLWKIRRAAKARR